MEASAVIANTPQVLLSCFYLLYNSMLTAMALTAELTSYGGQRKPLRVSKRRGVQRSTYWLSLPYRFAIPLISSMAVLHWLMSESIFLVQITSYDPHGVIDVDSGIYGKCDPLRSRLLPKVSYADLRRIGIGWSPTALLATLIVGITLFLALLGLSVRKYPAQMPIMSSNSFAISAACHRAENEDVDMVLLPLQYGVLKAASKGSRRRAVGFSSLAVERLQSDELYT